jgi:hypothetical protein
LSISRWFNRPSQEALPKGLLHDADRGAFTGPDLKRKSALVHQHPESVDRFGAGGVSLFEQKRHRRFIDEIADDLIGLQNMGRKKRRVVGLHADRCGVDDDIGLPNPRF